jgi:sec-independent protein translocase protein TatB
MSETAIRTLPRDRTVDEMFNLDPAKLLIIAVVAVILLGPDRLPQVARQIGGAWRSFNDYRHRMESQVRSSMPDLPSTSEIARLARSPSALLNHLSNMDAGDPTEPTGAEVIDRSPTEPTDDALPAMAPVPLLRPTTLRTPVTLDDDARRPTDPSLN